MDITGRTDAELDRALTADAERSTHVATVDAAAGRLAQRWAHVLDRLGGS